MIIFSICSSINTNHSIFSSQERFEQTLTTINSIRNRTEKSFIILCDNTPLEVEMKMVLIEKVDLFIDSFSSDFNITGVSNFNYNSGKSTGESYQMLIILNELGKMNYTKCFKLSGRYFLLENFDIHKFHNEKITFREFDYGYFCFGTVLYSFTKEHESILRDFFTNYLNSSRPHDLEISIHRLKEEFPESIYTSEYLGVSGRLGPSGTNLIH